MKRVFLVVLDSFGVGALPDAAAYGDEGSDTLLACAKTGLLHVPNLEKMGLFQIDGVSPFAAYGRMAEASKGKDTTTGHWELAGVRLDRAFPVFPNGFPPEVIGAFERKTGRGAICNRPYSGTDVIRVYGEEHRRTGAYIVYTSADSVFQIAAHEDVIPLEELYRACEIAREILTGEYAVGRVIARPFAGEFPFKRTENRRDFSLKPPRTLLNILKEAGKDVISVGKINDIFAGEGITRAVTAHKNEEGMAALAACAKEDFDGLCFVNLVDFDMLYGHRNDAPGCARAQRVRRLPALPVFPHAEGGSSDCHGGSRVRSLHALYRPFAGVRSRTGIRRRRKSSKPGHAQDVFGRRRDRGGLSGSAVFAVRREFFGGNPG